MENTFTPSREARRQCSHNLGSNTRTSLVTSILKKEVCTEIFDNLIK